MNPTGSRPRCALIVGAGIGGLAAAVALRRTGWETRVFERATHPRELGFALNLAPNAMAALDALGLAERVSADGDITDKAEIRALDGHALRRIDIAAAHRARKRPPSVIALRPVLHGALLSAIESNSLALGSEVVDFSESESGVKIKMADGRCAAGHILIGADGIHSLIRRRLHPHERPPHRSGYWAVRGVAYDVERHLGDLSAAAYFGHGMEAATARAGRGAIYWYVSLLADDLPRDTRDPSAIIERVAAGLDERFHAIARATKDEDIRLDELFDRDPIPAWGRGPVTLLGDAAHPMLPDTGQGAAQALEDAIALALALRSQKDPGAGLRKYESVRSARTARIVKLGRKMARITTTKSPLIGVARTLAARFLPEGALLAAFYLGGNHDPHREIRSSITQTLASI